MSVTYINTDTIEQLADRLKQRAAQAAETAQTLKQIYSTMQTSGTYGVTVPEWDSIMLQCLHCADGTDQIGAMLESLAAVLAALREDYTALEKEHINRIDSLAESLSTFKLAIEGVMSPDYVLGTPDEETVGLNVVTDTLRGEYSYIEAAPRDDDEDDDDDDQSR